MTPANRVTNRSRGEIDTHDALSMGSAHVVVAHSISMRCEPDAQLRERER